MQGCGECRFKKQQGVGCVRDFLELCGNSKDRLVTGDEINMNLNQSEIPCRVMSGKIDGYYFFGILRVS